MPDKPDKKSHVDIRCAEATMQKWTGLLWEKKKKGWDAEKLLLAMMDAYSRVPEGRYY